MTGKTTRKHINITMFSGTSTLAHPSAEPSRSQCDAMRKQRERNFTKMQNFKLEQNRKNARNKIRKRERNVETKLTVKNKLLLKCEIGNEYIKPRTARLGLCAF